MKNVDSFVYGVVFGIMLMFIFAGWYPEDKTCEVVFDYGNGNHKHVHIGVLN